MLDLHTEAGPEIVAGCAGTSVTARQRAGLAPQALFAITQMLPATLPKFTVMAVPELVTIVEPAGTDHE